MMYHRQFLSLALLLLLASVTPAIAIEKGEVAPSFTGNATTGPLSLADFKGKKNVVLAFYFRAFTPV